jgi:hypothetical protein
MKLYCGGARIYRHIQYSGGRKDRLYLATSLYSNNYRAEAKALKTAAVHIEVSPYASQRVVSLTDSPSILL